MMQMLLAVELLLTGSSVESKQFKKLSQTKSICKIWPSQETWEFISVGVRSAEFIGVIIKLKPGEL